VRQSVTGITVTLSSKADSALVCGATSRSPCVQRWLVTLNSNTDCIDNIQGVYNFVDKLVCRDNITNGVAGACPTGVTTIPLIITIHPTQLCASTPVDTSAANSFTLTPYSDAEHSISSVQFQTGETVYWTFEIQNPLVSIKSVTFNTIQLGLSGASDILYNTAVTSVGTAVGLNLQPLSDSISAGQSGTLGFSYTLLRSALPNTVGALQAAIPRSK